MTAIYTTAEGDTLDLICYNFYGDTTNRIVEQVLEKNQNLANYGAIYPLGVEIVLPDIQTAPEERDMVRLWTE